MVQNGTKAQTFDSEESGPYFYQLPSLPQGDLSPDNYLLPSYGLRRPLVYSLDQLQPFLQLQTQNPGVVSIKRVNSGKAEDTAEQNYNSDT